jgi:hypothetical protein
MDLAAWHLCSYVPARLDHLLGRECCTLLHQGEESLKDTLRLPANFCLAVAFDVEHSTNTYICAALPFLSGSLALRSAADLANVSPLQALCARVHMNAHSVIQEFHVADHVELFATKMPAVKKFFFPLQLTVLFAA